MSANSHNISFGTDGFRGVISRDFTFDSLRRIAQGFSDFLAYKYMRGNEKPKVVIGYDRRFMSDRFAEVFGDVLAAQGVDCTLSDSPLPTPAVSFLTSGKFDYGIMITASHNKYFYNGVKVKQGGRSAPPTATAELETYIFKASPHKVKSAGVPKKSFRKDYLSYLNSRLPYARLFEKVKGPVVVDFMYGCGAELAGDVFAAKNVVRLHEEHDPLFPGIHSPEPVESNLQLLIKTVKEKKAKMGVALDGDADRFALVSDKGVYMTPCQIAPMLLEYLIQRNKLKGKVIQAVSMGYLTKRIARIHNLQFEEVPVGFKYIAEKMISEDVSFGAEESGGYAWKGSLPERDGVLTALAFAEMTARTGKTISELYKDIEKKYGTSHFERVDFRLDKPITNKHSFAIKIRKKLPKTVIGKKIQEAVTLDGLKIVLEDDSWLLMRPSGTEPLLRTYAEAPSAEAVKKLLAFAKGLVEGK